MQATQAPPHLKAVFAFDAATDLYREMFSRVGIPQPMFFFWLRVVLMVQAMGIRMPDLSGIAKHPREGVQLKYPLDGPFWQERSAHPRLNEVRIPTYFGSEWHLQDVHLRGAFEGWEKTWEHSQTSAYRPTTSPIPPVCATAHGGITLVRSLIEGYGHACHGRSTNAALR